MLWEDLGSIASRILVPLNAGAVLQVSANNVATSSMWFANNVSLWGRDPHPAVTSPDVWPCEVTCSDFHDLCDKIGGGLVGGGHTAEIILLTLAVVSVQKWYHVKIQTSYDIMYAWCSSGRLASRWCFSPVFALAFPSSEANESQ